MSINDNIVYLYNYDSNPICRDFGEPFAKSLGLKSDDLKSWRYYLEAGMNLIIDLGWKTKESTNIISELLLKVPYERVYFRIVDDYPETYSEYDAFFAQNSILHRYRFISPYNHVYFGKVVPTWIPYHYEVNEELTCDFDEYLSRDNTPILTGAIDERIYPTRSMYNRVGKVARIHHPGYSGKCWSGNVGMDYLHKLAKYKFMVVTTCYQDYELLKYIECAEAGCCPIGEFTRSMLVTMPDALRQLQRFDDLIEVGLSGPYAHYLTMKYRKYIKSIYSKSNIINQINNLFV